MKIPESSTAIYCDDCKKERAKLYEPKKEPPKSSNPFDGMWDQGNVDLFKKIFWIHD